MIDHATGLQLLGEIKPVAPKRRFLQSWSGEPKVLRLGCGDNSMAVLVGSDGSVESSEVARATKLNPATVTKFLNGAQPDDSFGAVS